MSARRPVLPPHGRPAQALLETMQQARQDDVRWQDGRAFSLVFNPGEELSDFAKQAYTMFFSENALNPSAFPSLRRFENEVVAIVADLLGGDHHVVGNMTSGGTESILMAVKAARDWARAEHPVRWRSPQIVLPQSAHPAFDKAAHYFGLDLVHTPVGPDFRANVRAMSRAINRRTAMLVVSAPSYPQGVVDPVAEVADLALRHGLWCHVDACIGGLMLPFVRQLGRPVPAFDFHVSGVRSMSADLHKYGYAAKGASVVLYRDAGLRRYQYFAYADWPGGIYASPTMTGTRPGGAIAAAWAMLHRLGRDGYLGIADEVMQATDAIRHGVAEIDGLEILGQPDMSLLAIGAQQGLDIYAIGDELSARGWHIDRQQRPACLHVTVQRGHVGRTDAMLKDLREAVISVRQADAREPRRRRTQQVLLSATSAALRVLPRRVTRALTLGVARRMGVGQGNGMPERAAPMYGMLERLPNRGDLEEVVLDALDRLTRLDEEAGS